MDNIKNQLNTVMIKIINLRSNIAAANINHNTEFLNCINELNKLDRLIINNNNYDIFISNNLDELYLLEKTLVGSYPVALLNQSEQSQFRSYYDRIFKNKLKFSNFIYKTMNKVTEIFTEFTKGITYFADEVVLERPSYHRNASCGTKSVSTNIKFKKNSSNTENTVNRKKSIIRRCYLERLIYDNIYKQILHGQNIEHLNELRKVERYFQDYCIGEI
jgi:hypothetical protein